MLQGMRADLEHNNDPGEEEENSCAEVSLYLGFLSLPSYETASPRPQYAQMGQTPVPQHT